MYDLKRMRLPIGVIISWKAETLRYNFTVPHTTIQTQVFNKNFLNEKHVLKNLNRSVVIFQTSGICVSSMAKEREEGTQVFLLSNESSGYPKLEHNPEQPTSYAIGLHVLQAISDFQFNFPNTLKRVKRIPGYYVRVFQAHIQKRSISLH